MLGCSARVKKAIPAAPAAFAPGLFLKQTPSKNILWRHVVVERHLKQCNGWSGGQLNPGSGLIHNLFEWLDKQSSSCMFEQQYREIIAVIFTLVFCLPRPFNPTLAAGGVDYRIASCFSQVHLNATLKGSWSIWLFLLSVLGIKKVIVRDRGHGSSGSAEAKVFSDVRISWFFFHSLAGISQRHSEKTLYDSYVNNITLHVI